MVDIRTDVIPQAARARRYLWGLAVAVATASAVALGEINAQSSRLVDSQGRAWPFSVLVGPGFVEREAGWPEVLTGLIDDQLYRALLSWHLAIGLVFMITYGLLLAGLVAALFRNRGARIACWSVVGATVAFDLLENLCIVVLMLFRGPPAVVGLLWWCTTLKWASAAVIGAALLIRFVVPQRESTGQPGDQLAAPDTPVADPRAAVRRAARALMHQRFSLAMIIPLVVLTMLSGSAILEQLPDVQRRWASDGARGWLQALCAVVALVGVGILLEILGRFRTGWALRHQIESTPEEHPPPPPDTAADTGHAGPEPWLRPLLRRLGKDVRLIGTMIIELFTRPRRLRDRLRYLTDKREALLGLWLLGVLIPIVAALIAGLTMRAPVLGWRLFVFCAVPLAIVITSWVLRRAWQIRVDWFVPDRPPAFSAAEVSTIRFTGRALALTVGTVGGIGLVRSYIAVVVLGPDVTGVGRGPAVFFLVLGLAGVVLPWLMSWAATSGVSAMRDPLASIGTQEVVTLRGRWLLLGVVLTLFVALALLPGRASLLGVSAVTIASLTLLIGIPASAGLLIQERPTAEVFRILGLRRTPVVSVFVITIVLAGLTSGGNTMHQVASGTQVPSHREPVNRLVDSWLAQPGACEVVVDGQRVRPMIMIAAEGGGIRAAYWTVKGLAALDQGSGGCGAHSTLFSGGASGGSVGLTVARFAGTPGEPRTDRAVQAVRAMAAPDTLGQAVIGTFVRDPAYAATGVPLDTDGVAPDGTWVDRARLIELGWSRSDGSDPWGTKPFLSDPTQLSPATGPLVLNSSSVASQCRVWVSQLDLEQPLPTVGEQQCDQRVGPGARTIDLFAAYGPEGGTGGNCLGQVTASTAALLTARFPYVTPGGVVGGCTQGGATSTSGSSYQAESFWPRTQLIDGGYIENTGLATITDLSAQWLTQVRSHNDDVVASRSREPLIMPFVVFLTNEQATAGRLTQPPALQSELLLPAVGYLRGSATLTRTDALLQRVSTTVRTRAICPPPSSSGVDCDAIADRFARRVIVVDRTAQPEVTAPLGWVLSTASMTGLDRAMEHQVSATCSDHSTEPACLRGYGTLGDLLGYLRTS